MKVALFFQVNLVAERFHCLPCCCYKALATAMKFGGLLCSKPWLPARSVLAFANQRANGANKTIVWSVDGSATPARASENAPPEPLPALATVRRALAKLMDFAQILALPRSPWGMRRLV